MAFVIKLTGTSLPYPNVIQRVSIGKLTAKYEVLVYVLDTGMVANDHKAPIYYQIYTNIPISS